MLKRNTFFFSLFLGLFIMVFSAQAFEAVMVSPKYRNAIFAGTMDDPDSLKFRIYDDLSGKTIKATLSRNGKELATQTFSSLSDYQILSMDVSDVTFEETRSTAFAADDNPYELKLELKDRSAVTATITFDIHKYPEISSGDEVRMDDDDNFVVNGKKMLFIGGYGGLDPMSYDRFKEMGLNLWLGKSFQPALSGIHNYLSVAKAGMTPSDTIGTNYLSGRFRDQSYSMGYYIADEPGYFGPVRSTLQSIYKSLWNTDPYHPQGVADVMLAHIPTASSNVESYGYYGAMDFLSLDIYPCLAMTYTGSVFLNHKASRYEKGFYYLDFPLEATPQTISGGGLNARYPEPNESYNMAFQHLACGAKHFTAFKVKDTVSFNIWDTIATDMNSIKPAIFGKQVCAAVLPSYAFPRKDIAVIIPDGEENNIVWRYTTVDSTEYVFLVNTTNKWNTASGAPKNKDITVGVKFFKQGDDKVTVLIGDSNIPSSYTLSDGATDVTLKGVNSSYRGVVVLRRGPAVPGIEDVSVVNNMSVGSARLMCTSNSSLGRVMINMSNILENGVSAQSSLRIYDISGKMIFQKMLTGSQNKIVEWNTRNYSAGNYFINIKTGDKSYTENVNVVK